MMSYAKKGGGKGDPAAVAAAAAAAKKKAAERIALEKEKAAPRSDASKKKRVRKVRRSMSIKKHLAFDINLLQGLMNAENFQEEKKE